MELEKNITSFKNIELDVIRAFETKKWALYSFPDILTDLEELREIVGHGRVRDSIFPEFKHAILPLIEKDTDFDKMISAVEIMKYPPCLVESFSKVHPLDSIIYNGSFMLIVDKRLYERMGLVNPNPLLENPCIEISEKDIFKFIKYINSYRTNNSFRKVLH